MTVIIGMLCQDGVAIGTDSSATLDANGLRTIEQPAKKLDVVAGSILIAGTGQAGLGQRFQSVVDDYWRQHRERAKTHIQIAKDLCVAQLTDMASTGLTPGQFGALLGFPVGNQFYLCEFPGKDFQPEFKTADMWFSSCGSGQLIADPFLGFLRRIFWSKSPPLLADALFGISWALEQAFDLNAGGIKGPAQLGSLSLKNGVWTAELLDDNQLAEHHNAAQEAEAHLAKFLAQLRGAAKPAVPPLPIPVPPG